LVVTGVSEDTNLEINPDVDFSSGFVDLDTSLVVELGDGLEDPGLDSDGGGVDFGLTVGFKINNERSPVMDDLGFFCSVPGSPLDGDCYDFKLGLFSDGQFCL
jgi:hypothetical protein